jgi:hypothetical protein
MNVNHTATQKRSVFSVTQFCNINFNHTAEKLNYMYGYAI